MNLPRFEIKKWGVIVACLIAAIVIGYKAYQIHYQNITWCVTHSRPCDISRLENTRDELIKIKLLDETREIIDK